MTRVCKYCGKEFEATGRNASRAMYCSGPHFATCEVCGKKFEIKSFNNGVPRCCSSECSKKLRALHTRATLKQKYGVEYASQIPEVVEKANASRKIVQAASAEKSKKTCLAKYGVEHAMQSEATKEKYKNTCLAQLGVTNAASDVDVRNKISDAVRSESAKEKYRKTSELHYGASNPMKTAEVQNKVKSTTLARYGVEYPTQNSAVSHRMSTTQKAHRISDPSISEKQRNSLNLTCSERYGVEWPCQLEQCRAASNQIISRRNREFLHSLHELGVDASLEKSIGQYSYDVCIESQKIVIEIDPTYSHNSVGNHWNPDGLSSDYHSKKSATARSNGYRCIHVFDWDNSAKICESLKTKKLLYARDMEIRRLDNKQVLEFLEQYHFQGTCRGQLHCYGLFLEDELIQVMTFGKPRYNRKFDWELLRLCTKFGYAVVGGAGKLFKHFLKTVSSESIISYCDLAKFNGAVYSSLGFEHAYNTSPAKHWSSGSKHISSMLLLKRGYDQLFGTNYGKGTDNETLMVKAGWLPVYDCGQAVYIWKHLV